MKFDDFIEDISQETRYREVLFEVELHVKQLFVDKCLLDELVKCFVLKVDKLLNVTSILGNLLFYNSSIVHLFFVFIGTPDSRVRKH